MAMSIAGGSGKMGGRITPNIKDLKSYDVMYSRSVRQRGMQCLKRAFKPRHKSRHYKSGCRHPRVADRFIGKITYDIVPKLKSAAMVMSLDPAATRGRDSYARGFNVLGRSPVSPPTI